MKPTPFTDYQPSISEIVRDSGRLQAYISTLLGVTLQLLRKQEQGRMPETAEAEAMVASILDHAHVFPLPIYETRAHDILRRAHILPQDTPHSLQERANRIYHQITPYVQGPSVLDLGCGDGRVGEWLAQRDGLDVVLADIYQHAHIDETGLRFVRVHSNGTVPDTRQYDTTLLLTVLHHSDDPLETLEQAKQRTKPGGKIIVIESVFGIDKVVQEPNGDAYAQENARRFKALSPEEQRQANIFFDHFYNRVIHFSPDPAKKVNVPFNFNTPEGWKAIFEEHGFQQERLVYLGFDQPVVPEYHTLHVLRI